MKDIETMIFEARKEAGCKSGEKVLVDLDEYVSLRRNNEFFNLFLKTIEKDLHINYGKKLYMLGGDNTTALYKILFPAHYDKIYEQLKEEEESADGSV